MIGEEEKRAVMEVLDSGVLSDYLASWGDKFMGGEQVQALEREWAEYFGVKHAVAMNSATSGLYAAMGAIGIEPGDEVIVSPYSMVASATAPLIYGGVPVFADIEEDTFCIDPMQVQNKITDKTKAIIAVDLFGHPAQMDTLAIIANTHGLYLIEDAAQAAGAKYHGRYAGTLGDIGVYSLNYHKTIHCGEGGIVVTDDAELAERLRLIRNHAEACTGDLGKHQDLIGFNYRLTEIQAAIARVQLTKLEELILERQIKVFEYDHMFDVFDVTLPVTREGIKHGWYLYAMKAQAENVGNNVRLAEHIKEHCGMNTVPGYVRPIYYEPIFKQFGNNYLPVVERMHYQELVYVKIP